MLKHKRNPSLASPSISNPSQSNINTSPNTNTSSSTHIIPSTLKSETFLLKLFQILQTSKYSSSIHWSEDGNSIIISNITELSKKILPKFFKHRNYASFVRQLNMYNFHKVRSCQNQNEQIFQHENFTRNQTSENILKIKRKIKYDITLEKKQTSIKDDYEVIENFTDALKHKAVSKTTIEHMMVFLLNKTKESLQMQERLQKQVEELTTKNQELIKHIYSPIKKQHHAIDQNLKAALVFFTNVMKKESLHRLKNAFVKSLNKSSSLNNNNNNNNNIKSNNNNINTNERKDEIINDANNRKASTTTTCPPSSCNVIRCCNYMSPTSLIDNNGNNNSSNNNNNNSNCNDLCKHNSYYSCFSYGTESNVSNTDDLMTKIENDLLKDNNNINKCGFQTTNCTDPCLCYNDYCSNCFELRNKIFDLGNMSMNLNGQLNLERNNSSFKMM